VAAPLQQSTPDTVWGYYGLTPEQAVRGGLNPKMFNSFLDGSKPSIESTAVSNATGLGVPSNGLLYPPASVEDIPYVTRPVSEGGVLERKGMVEVISSLEADGRKIPYDIRMGVWVTVEAETEYIKNCFEEYNAHTDPSGRYFTLYKRWHLIGLEVGVSVASVALRGEPTGVATAGMPMWWPPPSVTWRPAKCSMVKAATPSGASSCQPPPLRAWAVCRWVWRTASRWFARSRRASR
jgi:predicted homoserine dehydrogenase-like protein